MIIQYLDGSRIDLSDYGVNRLFHRISSIEVEDNAEIVTGRDGDIPSPDFRYASRNISVDFVYQVRDIQDFYLMRDQVNSALTSRKDFFIIFKKEPYVRWRVRRLASFEIPPNPKGEVFTVEFKCSKVRGEARLTTLQMQKGDRINQWDDDVFAWNDTINWDEEFNYEYSGERFIVNNAGTSTVNPRFDDLTITMKPGIHLTGGFSLHNEMTGDIFAVNGGLDSGTFITIEGVRVWIGSQSAFNRTNHRLITLQPGPNSIRVLSHNGSTPQIEFISFDFRFMYE